MAVKSMLNPPDVGDSKQEMGKQISKFMAVKWKNEKRNMKVPTANYKENSNLSGGGNTIFCSSRSVENNLRISTKGSSKVKTTSYSFDNKTLDAVSLDVDTSAPTFLNGHWNCNIQEDATRQKRIKISNVKIYEDGMVMGHNVFDSIEFRDVAIEFEFSKDPSIKIIEVLDLTTPFYIERSAGILGQTDDDIVEEEGDAPYQAGVAQDVYYWFRCNDIIINLCVQYSFVFRYPMNDFEPGGVIDASKVYPQIMFSVETYNVNDTPAQYFPTTMSIRPSGMSDEVANSVVISGYKGRVKMVVNVNSQHYVTPQVINGQTYNQNFFGDLRQTGSFWIPEIFDRVFKPDYYGSDNTRNLLGFFTDSNSPNGINENGGRLRPPYEGPFGLGNPFWFNVFDYAHYDVQNSIEFVAVDGIQTSDTAKYADGQFKKRTFPSSFYPSDYVTHPSPTSTAAGPPVVYQGTKLKRQGGFDNIHLHGYLGHYKDNDKLVIHAPVCAHCCFHMHWRWSEFNVDVSKGLPLPYVKRFNNSASFKGWDDSNSNIESGAPLIPYNQHLKIAATPPDYTPYNSFDTVLAPGATVPLVEDKKAIWYCVDVKNTSSGLNDTGGSFKSHVILEQGCGYAFNYSSLANNIASGLLQPRRSFAEGGYFDLTLADLGYNDQGWPQFFDAMDNATLPAKVIAKFEIQYRLMHFFNRARLNPNGWNSMAQSLRPQDFSLIAAHYYKNFQNDDPNMNNVDQIPTFHSNPDLLSILQNL